MLRILLVKNLVGELRPANPQTGLSIPKAWLSLPILVLISGPHSPAVVIKLPWEANSLTFSSCLPLAGIGLSDEAHVF